MKKTELIAQLHRQIEQLRQGTLAMQQMEPSLLLATPAPGSWGAAQCYTHMVIATEHYLQRLPKAALKAKADQGTQGTPFSPGKWGEKLTNSMMPTDTGERKGKMKTMGKFVPKKKDPAAHLASLPHFLQQLDTLDSLVELWATRDLHRPLITAAVPIFRLKPGDAFRFLLAHALRHMLQAQQAIQAVSRQRKAA